jgi:hypothetical protein
MFIVIADTAAPSTNSMIAQVTSYNSGTGALVVDVKGTLGSGTKTAWTISQTTNPLSLDDSVTFARMQNIATQRIIGRNTAASGDPEEVTLTQVLDWIGSAAQGDILYRGASSWARLAAGSAGQLLKTGGVGANPAWSYGPVLWGVQTASGTSVDFTGLPSWARWALILFAGVSYNANAQPMLQGGTSGGIDATGYVSAGGDYVPTANHNSSTAGFIIGGGTVSIGAAANLMHGGAEFFRDPGSNLWVMRGQLSSTGTANTGLGAGTKTFSSAMDRIRCTTVAGTATHDAGSFIGFYG